MKNLYKILLPIVAFLISAYSGQAQVTSIDAKNGFKDFKLGDLKSKWASSMQFLGTNGDVQVYQYTGTCCQEMFDLPIKQINLAFSKRTGKLIQIAAVTQVRPYDRLNQSEYLHYYEDRFFAGFGTIKPTAHEDIDDKYKLEKWTYMWKGAKAVLSVNTFYGSTIAGSMLAEINVYDKAYSEASYSSGF